MVIASAECKAPFRRSALTLREIDILAIGEPMVEFNENQTGSETVYRPGHGGDTSNAIVAAVERGVW